MINDESPVELPAPKRPRWFWFRIAMSLFFGLLAVALCVLWVRSHHWARDAIQRVPVVGGIHFISSQGSVSVEAQRLPKNPPKTFSWNQSIKVLSKSELAEVFSTHTGSLAPDYSGFQFRFRSGADWKFSVPYWLLALVSGMLATVLGLRINYRFSLRTLLIATTLLAVMLGVVVWAGR